MSGHFRVGTGQGGSHAPINTLAQSLVFLEGFQTLGLCRPYLGFTNMSGAGCCRHASWYCSGDYWSICTDTSEVRLEPHRCELFEIQHGYAKGIPQNTQPLGPCTHTSSLSCACSRDLADSTQSVHL
jgi:hypothetical protein